MERMRHRARTGDGAVKMDVIEELISTVEILAMENVHLISKEEFIKAILDNSLDIEV